MGDFDDVEIIDVFITEGDYVSVDDPLITLETEKAAMDIPSPFSGKVASLFVKTGTNISEGDDICELITDDNDANEGSKEKISEYTDKRHLLNPICLDYEKVKKVKS